MTLTWISLGLLAWIVVSLPLAILVGRFSAGNRAAAVSTAHTTTYTTTYAEVTRVR